MMSTKTLVELLPSIHITMSAMLLLFVIYRAFLLYMDTPRATAKGIMNAFSFLVMAVFFSGIAPAFAMGIPFSHPFILFKLIGFIGFTALNLVAFAANTKRRTAFMLLTGSLLLYLSLALSFHIISTVPA